MHSFSLPLFLRGLPPLRSTTSTTFSRIFRRGRPIPSIARYTAPSSEPKPMGRDNRGNSWGFPLALTPHSCLALLPQDSIERRKSKLPMQSSSLPAIVGLGNIQLAPLHNTLLYHADSCSAPLRRATRVSSLSGGSAVDDHACCEPTGVANLDHLDDCADFVMTMRTHIGAQNISSYHDGPAAQRGRCTRLGYEGAPKKLVEIQWKNCLVRLCNGL